MAFQPCSVCTSPYHDAINGDLITPGRSFTAIAKRYNVGISSLYRHHAACIQDLVKQSQELRTELSAKNLRDMLHLWIERMEEQYQKADDMGDIRGSAIVARVAIQAIEAHARLGVAAELERRLAELETSSANVSPLKLKGA